MKNRKAFIIVVAILLFSITCYFYYLLHQVETAFESAQEFIPTRIYSNVTRISPPMPRDFILRKLKNLGYKVNEQADSLSFTLHSPSYPTYLLPQDHPTRSLMDHTLKLVFESNRAHAPLESIQSDQVEVNEFYLEPEFLATLSKDKNEQSTERADQIREVLKLSEFPKLIADGVMAAEDQHFYSHFGIDPRGFARAVWVNLKTLSFTQGGSTITQQLVKNLMERRNRNLIMKVSELFLAPMLEIKYTKDQILERYLNEVFLGQIGAYEVRGFSEGAKYFFGKKVTDLNTAEIALMVGLIKGPAFYSPHRHFDRAKNRQRYVLERMLSTKKIPLDQYNRAMNEPIRLAQPQSASNRAPYFVDYVKAELFKILSDRFQENEISDLGLQVYTTLDIDQNIAAQNAIQTGIEQIEKKWGWVGPGERQAEPQPELQGALISMDQSTGEIRALVGGRNYSTSNFNRILNMKRQVGSTFKPLVYLTALKQGMDPKGNTYTPAYPLRDEPWEWKYDESKPAWKPGNYEKENLGWISFRTSLIKSINTTTAQLAQRIGLGDIVETAKSLGIQSKLLPVPALSLGGFELSPLELLSAYATLANHGHGGNPIVIRAITNSDGSAHSHYDYQAQARINAGAADLMTDLLKGVFTQGTAISAGALGFNRPAAGKTGTTNDYRDAWFAGYTPQLTTVVWVGLDQGVISDKLSKKKIKLTGATAALPVWISYMNQALKYAPELPFPESEHLVEMRLDSKSGQKAEGSCAENQVVFEKVIQGQEPKNSTCLDDFLSNYR